MELDLCIPKDEIWWTMNNTGPRADFVYKDVEIPTMAKTE